MSQDIHSLIKQNLKQKLPVSKIMQMLAGCIRNKEIFVKSRGNLVPNLFTEEELSFALVWTAVLNLHKPDINKDLFENELAYRQAVEIEVHSLFDRPEIKSHKFKDFAYKNCFNPEGLIDFIFNLSRDLLHTKNIALLLSSFLIERKINDQIFKVIQLDNHYIHEVDSIIKLINQQYQKCVSIANQSQQNLIDFISPEKLFATKPETFSSGIPWLDEMLGGGMAPKECYVLTGPTGGGKSFLCTQIAVRGAELQALKDRQTGKGKYWYYFTYELSFDQILPRIIEFGAKIHVDTVLRGNLEDISDCNNLKEYEHSEYVNPSGLPYKLGEKERIEQFKQRLKGRNDQALLEIVDFSASKSNGIAMGNDGIPEIERFLYSRAEEGKPPIGIIIDYALQCVYRYVESRGLDPKTIFSILPNFVDKVHNSIATPFGCCVWIVHQLHGNATKKGKQSIIHHSEAFGSRNFGMGADFCFQLSDYCEHTRLVKLHMTKARRGSRNSEGKVLEFRPEFGVFLEPEREYVQDSSGNYIPADYARIIGEIVENQRSNPRIYNRSTSKPFSIEDLLN